MASDRLIPLTIGELLSKTSSPASRWTASLAAIESVVVAPGSEAAGRAT